MDAATFDDYDGETMGDAPVKKTAVDEEKDYLRKLAKVRSDFTYIVYFSLIPVFSSFLSHA